MSQYKIVNHPKLTAQVKANILEVAKTDEAAARKLIRKVMGVSRSRGNEWFTRVKNEAKNITSDGGENLGNLPEELKTTSREAKVVFTNDKGVAESINPDVRTLEDLLKVCKVDLSVWEVEKHVINKWAVAMREPATTIGGRGEGAKLAEGGNSIWTRGSHVPVREPLFQVKAWLKRIVSKSTEDILKDLKADMIGGKSPVQKITRNKKGSYLLEMALFDLHLGKLAWGEESGENYDMKIAKKVYREAVQDLVSKALQHGEIEEIVFPIGNDYLHVDSQELTTTAGTRQDADGRAKKIFREGRKLLVETIDYLKTIAPVKVVVIVGNHDTLSMFHLGDAIECWYHQDPSVTIDNSAPLRKYHIYGKNMICYTHGDKEKREKLPQIIASERAKDWGQTTYREIHVGHRHMEETNEYNGTKVRTIPSLSRNDAWHTGQGYGANKSAVALLFHRETGLSTICYHNSQFSGDLD